MTDVVVPVDPVDAVADEVAQRAAATVRRHSLDADDEAELLDALGLSLNEGGGSPTPLPSAPVQVAYAALARAVLAGGDEGQASSDEVGL